jgi:hypothetical protein
MGWTNSHLYEIRAGDVGWSEPDPDWGRDGPLDARKARLGRRACRYRHQDAALPVGLSTLPIAAPASATASRELCPLHAGRPHAVRSTGPASYPAFQGFLFKAHKLKQHSLVVVHLPL